MRRFSSILVMLICLATGCTQYGSEELEVFELDLDKELIPEGIAIHQGSIYLSSLYQRKIVKTNLLGESPVDLIGNGEYSFLLGLGMETHGDTLYAVSSTSTEKNHRSKFLALNPRTGQLYKDYKLQIQDSSYFLNDLAIGKSGSIYLSDSDNKTIYKVGPSSVVEPFISADQIQHTNGIAISDDERNLYGATYRNGIQVIDLTSKQIKLLAYSSDSIDTKRIDGLKYYKNSLIGIQNGYSDFSKHRVVQFILDDHGTKIVEERTLVSSNEYFNLPTTFDIYQDKLYFIANSQMTHFDEPNHTIIRADQLTPYYLLVLDLESID